MPSPHNPPALPRPAAKLGCLGGSAVGSEGLATPSTAEGRGQGLRGIISPFGRARQELFGKELLPVKGSHIQRGITVPRHTCGSCQLGWRSHHILPPLLNLGIRKVYLCHRKTGVLPQGTGIPIKEMPFCVHSFHSLLNTQPPRPVGSAQDFAPRAGSGSV